MDLSSRSIEAEILDDPSVGFGEYRTALRQIALLNQLTSAYTPILSALARLRKRHGSGHIPPIRILDVGCGYGDTLRAIHRWAAGREIPVELTGIDISPWSERAARETTPADVPIAFITSDVFHFRPPEPFHVILNSLFAHHLDEPGVTDLLRWMTEHSLWGWFVSDLHRNPVPYYFIKYFVRLAGFNRLLKNDAPLSVARSFVREDWERMIRKAGLDRSKIDIRWLWAFRYGILYFT